MTYLEFKDRIHDKLSQHPAGLTWAELQTVLKLSYTRPCPEWIRRLEHEIGLVRSKQPRSRAWVWQAAKKK